MVADIDWDNQMWNMRLVQDGYQTHMLVVATIL